MSTSTEPTTKETLREFLTTSLENAIDINVENVFIIVVVRYVVISL
jgi:hypothetical protein